MSGCKYLPVSLQQSCMQNLPACNASRPHRTDQSAIASHSPTSSSLRVDEHPACGNGVGAPDHVARRLRLRFGGGPLALAQAGSLVAEQLHCAIVLIASGLVKAEGTSDR